MADRGRTAAPSELVVLSAITAQTLGIGTTSERQRAWRASRARRLPAGVRRSYCVLGPSPEERYAGAAFLTRTDLEKLAAEVDALPWPAGLKRLPALKVVDVRQSDL